LVLLYFLINFTVSEISPFSVCATYSSLFPSSFYRCQFPSLTASLPFFFFSRIYLLFFSFCCRRYYIVLSLAPIGLLPVRLSTWLACMWGCRIVKGLCQYTSSVFRSQLLACISIFILRELHNGAHCSPALDYVRSLLPTY
jgi:hypothetical protein